MVKSFVEPLLLIIMMVIVVSRCGLDDVQPYIKQNLNNNTAKWDTSVCKMLGKMKMVAREMQERLDAFIAHTHPARSV